MLIWTLFDDKSFDLQCFLLVEWTAKDVLFVGVWCRKEDYSALRASPSGSACGRSNWLRQFVEPSFCLSGVRMR
jgi:hypothetical protein